MPAASLGAISIRLAVDPLARSAVRHVDHAPPVLRLRVDLDFGGHFRRFDAAFSVVFASGCCMSSLAATPKYIRTLIFGAS